MTDSTRPPEPMRYHAGGLRVFDENQRLLCECVDEETAHRVADALEHLAAYEYEHTPLTSEDIARLNRALEQFVAEYDASHPDFDPDRIPFAGLSQ